MKEINNFSEEERDVLKFLKDIQKKYKYQTPEETVSHYLQRIYPDPATLNDPEYYYNQVELNLLKLLQGQKQMSKFVRLNF